MSVEHYLSIDRSALAEIEVKRSRFRCELAPVASEEAAREVVAAARRAHWDARHHCSAMILGPAGDLARSSDDGEPAGTAGAPMLEALRGAGLSDVVAVVTRWFGGTLLGAGGLVRAYGDAVRQALAASSVVRRELVEHHEVVVGHATAGRLEHELRTRGVEVVQVDHGAAVRMVLAMPAGQDEALTAMLAEATGGTAIPRVVGQGWVDRPQHPGPALSAGAVRG